MLFAVSVKSQIRQGPNTQLTLIQSSKHYPLITRSNKKKTGDEAGEQVVVDNRQAGNLGKKRQAITKVQNQADGQYW